MKKFKNFSLIALICCFMLALSCMVFAPSTAKAEGETYGYTEEGTDFYYYKGGSGIALKGASTSAAFMGTNNCPIWTNGKMQYGEVSFDMTMPSGGISDLAFFGLIDGQLGTDYSTKMNFTKSATDAGYVFRLGTSNGSFKMFTTYSAGANDWINISKLGAEADFAKSSTVSVRMVVAADGSLSIYMKSSKANYTNEVQVAYYEGLYSGATAIRFAFTTKARTDHYVTFNNIKMIDQNGKILLMDDGTLFTKDMALTAGASGDVVGTGYIARSEWQTNYTAGQVAVATPSTALTKYLSVSAEDATVFNGVPTDLLVKATTFGTGATLTVAVVDAEGNAVAANEDGKYQLTVNGQYTATYTYTDNNFASNAATATCTLDVMEATWLNTAGVPTAAEAGVAVDLTPVKTDLFTEEYALKVSIDGVDITESVAAYKFAKRGTYTVKYEVMSGESSLAAVTVEVAVTQDYLEVPAIANTQKGKTVDVTPVTHLDEGDTVSVSIVKYDNATGEYAQLATVEAAEGKYEYTFAESGYFKVKYEVVGSDDAKKAEGVSNEIRVENTNYAYLSVNKIGVGLTNQLIYLNNKFSGAGIIEIEARLGESQSSALMFGLYSATDKSMFTQFTDDGKSSFWFGSTNYKYYDAAEKTPTLVNAYKDGGSSKANYFYKTTFKLVVAENGNVTVYAKLTEDRSLFKGTDEQYEALSANYTEIYTASGMYSEAFLSAGYYFGFAFKNASIAGSIDLFNVKYSTLDGAVAYNGNFYNFEIGQSFVTQSNDIKNNASKLFTYVSGREKLVPSIVVNLPGQMLVGEEVDVTPEYSGMEDDEKGTITVVDQDGDEIEAASGNVYKLEEQGIYTVTYATTVGLTISREIIVKKASTQPTVELTFDSAWREDRIASTNATMADGKLTLEGEGAHFATAGVSESFILTVKIDSISEGGAVSIAYGVEGSHGYILTLTAEGIVYKNLWRGEQQSIEDTKGLYNALASGKYIIVRLTVMSNVASISAIIEGEPAELIGEVLGTLVVECIGQVGILSDNKVVVDEFKFVNLTSVPNDNTTTEAPELPDEEPEDPIQPDDSGDQSGDQVSNCAACSGGMGATGIISLCGLAVVSLFRKNGKK